MVAAMTTAKITIEEDLDEPLVLHIHGRVEDGAATIHRIVDKDGRDWSEFLSDSEHGDCADALLAAEAVDREDAERDAGEQDAEWEDG
jgi:hypothetical protein